LIDAGDCLQGDNAAYYYNYVDTLSPHLFPRLVSYMKYDVVTVGNHDIETGHPVYDRVAKDLDGYGIPFMAGNALRNSDKKPYFPMYKVFNRAGLKVAVLGFTNPNMKAWLDEGLWYGMTFENLIPLVQEDVDAIIAKEKPQVVIVSVHSGTGNGDGQILESQGLDLFKSLKGVDFLICSHDHRPFVSQTDSICLINTGSHARNVGFGEIKVSIKDGKVVSKDLSARLIPVKAEDVDTVMREHFRDDYLKVKAFTEREIGQLNCDLVTRDSYKGMCDYINLIHTVCLGASPAQISFAAPLTYNKTIKAGKLIYNDLFTIYPYENQLFVVKMSGEEIKNFLEFSYNLWLSSDGKHTLNIADKDDPRTGQKSWSFVERSYNFDSAAGINYTVDVTKPYGSRISIASLADGTPFNADTQYNVAMTSYRASGGGGAMPKGAGIKDVNDRIVARYPEIRNMIHDYIVANGSIDSDKIGDKNVIGSWDFIPEASNKKINQDFLLLFPYAAE